MYHHAYSTGVSRVYTHGARLGFSTRPVCSTRPSGPPHRLSIWTVRSPPSNYQQLPGSSLLATSLYPLLTLGIAGGAVSGELGAAAWNAFQQSQLQQAQAQQHSTLGQSSGLGQSHVSGLPSLHQSSGLPGLGSHPSFMSQSQPMSTLSSSLDSSLPGPSGLSRLDSSSSGLPPSGLPRIDSPSGLPQSLESMRTSSPSSTNAFSSPRFEPSSSRFEPVFTESNSTSTPPAFGSSTSTPPAFGSSSSSTPGYSGGTHVPEGRRSSSSSRRDDVP